MQYHLEFIKEEPFFRLVRVQVVIEISGSEAEGVKLLGRSQEQDRRSLLVVHPRIITCKQKARKE